MTVYVDDFNVPFHNMIMCHMIADTVEELNDMARKIDIWQGWLQGPAKFPHYDVTLSKKKLAIKHGAKAITSRELVAIRMKIIKNGLKILSQKEP